MPVICFVGLVGHVLLLLQLVRHRRTFSDRLRVHMVVLACYDCVLIVGSFCAYGLFVLL